MMLDELHAQNVALIRDAVFSPASGLTVITGESGTGKTALLSALKLLVGERADSATVREGAASALVEGRFFLSSKDGDSQMDGCVVRRKVASDGRSRVSVDDSMATVTQLASTVGASVDLCGQHEHQHLLKPVNHASMLDAWAGDSTYQVLKAYQAAFDEAASAARELECIKEAARASSEQLSQARFILARIDEVAPSQEEYDEIMRELPRVENAEVLARAAEAAHWELSREGGAVDATRAAIRALEQAVQTDPSLSAAVEALTDASYTLEDVARDVRVYRDGIDHDPAILENIQERIGTLQGLMRSYGPRMKDVLARRDEAARTVAAVDDADRLLSCAKAKQKAAEDELIQKARALEDVRAQAAPRFAEQVNVQMARLEMGTAELVCSMKPLPREQWTRAGASKVEFLYRAAEGMTARPLARIASGGEMSRVMLACKVVLGTADERETLVFDEVDAGVGGSAARSLAAVIADLAKTHQVIVVTHLAQIAVFGDVHYLVRKTEGGGEGIPETQLFPVEGEERVAEIARMLSGEVNEASKAHAREMFVSARSRNAS